MTESVDGRALRRELRRAYLPFFGRFGGMTAAQSAAIPHVLAGRDVLVASPTASGKTEAIVAPLAELSTRERWTELSCIYIVPTRALVNDLAMRLTDPLEECGIQLAAKHGDKPRLPRELPDWIVTTPESMDSLLARNEIMFTGLRALVLDEVHLLDGTYRGDQLRILKKRADAVSSFGVRTYLMTATAADPKGLADRYAPNAVQVIVPGHRSIESGFVDDIDAITDVARERGWRKLLCFCNRRASVEEVASRLADRWRPYPVLVHHGSLARRVREETEQVLRENRTAICVATSTLELGIDIGDVDAIVLAEIPWSVDSFLQRIGRGNRRTGACNVLVVAGDAEQVALGQSMVEAAEQGRLDVRQYQPDLSVVVQQYFSYLYAHPGGTSAPTLLELVSPLCDEATGTLILTHLGRERLLEFRGGAWTASTEVMDLGEHGTVHSNIPDSEIPMTVVEAASGQPIGTVTGTVDGRFSLGRRVWEVVGVKDGTITVAPGAGVAASARFRAASNQGAFRRFLPPSLSRTVKG